MNFLDSKQIIKYHDDIIDAVGGSTGLRDINLLESAIASAEQTYTYDENSDAYDLAACYLYSIANNHAFNDGNKRTASVAAYAFLELNDIEVKLTDKEFEDLALGAATKQLDKKQIADILRK